MQYKTIPQLSPYPLAQLQDEDLFEVAFWNGTTFLSCKITGAVIKAAASGGAVWGDITGNINNQSDLIAALAAKFNNPSGTALQYIDGTGAVQTFPTIPAAQVNSDWNAVSGVSQILNKPTIPAAQVNSDWNALSGLAAILNKPNLAAVATSGSYNDLINTPDVPPNITCLQFAASNETSPLAVASNLITLRSPYDFYCTEVRASLTSAQTAGSVFTVNVLLNGTSMFSTLLSIDNGESTSVTAAIPAVISNPYILDDVQIRVNVTQIGNSTATGLKITLLGTFL